MRTRHARAVGVVAAAVGAMVGGREVRATDRYWVGPNLGSWSTAAYWSPASVPVTGDNVYVIGSASGNVLVGSGTPAYASPGLNLLQVDGSGGTIMGVSQPVAGTSIYAQTEEIGYAGRGLYVQSAGSNTTPTLYVGYTGGSTGSYTLSGGTLSSTAYAYVGLVGTGSFIQSGGTHTVGGSLLVAYNPGGTGTYTLSGGALSVPSAIVSDDAGTVGTFAQSGGTSTFSSVIAFAGYNPQSYGELDLSQSASMSANQLVLGSIGRAVANQTGGSLAVTGTLTLGAQASANGSYVLSGGTLTAGALTVGDQGAGSLSVSGTGSANVTGAIIVGNAPSSSGSVALYGGSLSAGTLTNNGSYYQSGGALTAAVTNNGQMTVAGGSVTATGASAVVNNGSLAVANAAFGGSAGVINNGQLTVSGATTFGGTGSFSNNAQFVVQSGNVTLAATGFNSNSGNMNLASGWQLRLPGSGLTNYGTLNLNGATVSGGGTLVDRYGATIAGSGLITAPLSVQGGRILLTDGTLNVTSAFASSGVIQLNGPGASLNGGTVTNTGTIQGQGSVSNGITNLGGTVEAMGGTLVLAGTVSNPSTGLIAVDPGAKLLVAGTLLTNAGTVNVNGGTFDMNGQTMQNSGIVAGYGVIRTGGLSNYTSMTLTGGNTTVNGAVTNYAGATVNVRYNPALFTGAVNNSGTFTVTGTTVTFASSSTGISAPDGVAVDGGAASPMGLGLDVSDGGVGGGGVVSVDAAGAVTVSYLRQGTLENAGHVTLRPASQGGQTSVLNALTLTGGGTFDLADNRLVLDYAGASPIDAVRQYLLSSQLVSSTAAADVQHRMAIGYAEASALGVAAWGGQAVDATAVVTKLTWYGDANLDGKINADDYALIDRGFAGHLGGWVGGDFDYSGTVDAADYLLIDRVFVQQGGTLSPGVLASREAQFGAGYVEALVASVPEPGVGMIGVLMLAAVGRRRRKPAASAR